MKSDIKKSENLIKGFSYNHTGRNPSFVIFQEDEILYLNRPEQNYSVDNQHRMKHNALFDGLFCNSNNHAHSIVQCPLSC